MATAAGTSAGPGPAVAQTAAKTKMSQHTQRTSALHGTSTDPSKTQAKTAKINTTAGPRHPTHPPHPVTPPVAFQQAAVTGQTGTVTGAKDVYARSWQVQTRKGKGKRTQQALCPCKDPSGPPAPAQQGNQSRRLTKKERRQERRREGKATSRKQANAASGKINFSAGERSQAEAGTSRPMPIQPHTSTAGRSAAYAGLKQQPGGKDQAMAKRALNETLSPRGEHKRPRLDQSCRVAQRSYAQAANASLNVAITCERTGIIGKDVSDKVLAAIQKRIVVEACSPTPDSPGPAFNSKPQFTGGVLKLWCNNDHTLGWLKKTISDWSLSTNTTLVVRSQTEIQKRVRAGIVIPDEHGVYEDTTNIGRALGYQNPWVDVKRWILVRSDKQNAAWFVVLGVPEDQIPTLMAAERRLAIGVGSVYMKFQGQNGRFVDTPRGWDPATKTICDTQTEETAPPPNIPVATAARPAVAESAAPDAIVDAVPSPGVELDDIILSPSSNPGGDGFDEGDLLAGLRLVGDEEGSIDGDPFIAL